MAINYNNFFSENRENSKTFSEIKKQLKSLFNNTKKLDKNNPKNKEKINLLQNTKKKIENNIIENLKEGLKIISGDYLYPLKYLTTYETIFNFEKKANTIFPGDILKLEGENLIILRKGKKINIGKIIIKSDLEKNKSTIKKNPQLKINTKKIDNNNKKNTEKSIEIKKDDLEIIKKKTQITLNNIEKIDGIKNKDIIKFFSELLEIKNNKGEITKNFAQKIKDIQKGTKDGVLGLNTIDDIIQEKNIPTNKILVFLNYDEKIVYKNIIENKYEKKYPKIITNIFKKLKSSNFSKLSLGEQILISTLKKVEIKK